MNLEEENIELKRLLSRSQKQYEILREWIYSEQIGHQIGLFFQKRHINNIAIYGDGDIGLLLCNELMNKTDVKVKYFIDRQNHENPFGITYRQAYDISKTLLVDLVVVTTATDFDIIKNKLIKEGATEVVSILDVLKKA